MRVLGLGVVYGGGLGAGLAAVFGVIIATAGPQLGLALPHNLAGASAVGVVLNMTQVGLIAGLIGGAVVGLIVRWGAAGRESRARWIGLASALLPLVWLPYFALRGILRRGTLTVEDGLFFALLVMAPLALAGAAGAFIGSRLARAAAAG